MQSKYWSLLQRLKSILCLSKFTSLNLLLEVTCLENFIILNVKERNGSGYKNCWWSLPFVCGFCYTSILFRLPKICVQDSCPFWSKDYYLTVLLRNADKISFHLLLICCRWYVYSILLIFSYHRQNLKNCWEAEDLLHIVHLLLTHLRISVIMGFTSSLIDVE